MDRTRRMQHLRDKLTSRLDNPLSAALDRFLTSIPQPSRTDEDAALDRADAERHGEFQRFYSDDARRERQI